jgi:hypothetical protein
LAIAWDRVKVMELRELSKQVDAIEIFKGNFKET